MLKTFFSQLSALFAQNPNAFFILVFSLFVFFSIAFFFGSLFSRIVINARLSKRIAAERADAVKKSRAVLGGLAGEQVAPFLPGFPCNPADARFVGKPVDFVAFSGAADGGEIKEILLIEVKSGETSLSKREREIKACVQEGRLRFVEYRIN